MVVTKVDWANESPVGQTLAESVQAWRCMAWTEETLNFWVISSEVLPFEPSGWMVDGPEVLLEAAQELEPGSFAVYVIERSAAGAARLCQVTSLWQEGATEDATSGFWYANDAGELKPCSPTQLPPRTQLKPVVRLVSERQFGAMYKPV